MDSDFEFSFGPNIYNQDTKWDLKIGTAMINPVCVGYVSLVQIGGVDYYQVYVFSATVKNFIPRGSPHKTLDEARRDLRSFFQWSISLLRITSNEQALHMVSYIRALERKRS